MDKVFKYFGDFFTGLTALVITLLGLGVAVEILFGSGAMFGVTVIENVDTNDCSDGTVAGALLGGGLAGFGSRGKDRWWAIPSGIIGGAMLGCAVDGG